MFKTHLRLLILGLAVVTLGASLAVRAYSSATVSTDAKVSVTDSRDALVALEIKPVETNQGDSGAFICGWITNNLPGCIWDLQLSGGFEVANAFLDTGNGTPVLINLTTTHTLETGNLTFPGRVLALWEGGEAEIEFEVPVQVNEILPPAGVVGGKGGTAAGKIGGEAPGGGVPGNNSGGEETDEGYLPVEDNPATQEDSNAGESGQESGSPQAHPGSGSDEIGTADISNGAESEIQNVPEASGNSGTVSDASGNKADSLENVDNFDECSRTEPVDATSDGHHGNPKQPAPETLDQILKPMMQGMATNNE